MLVLVLVLVLLLLLLFLVLLVLLLVVAVPALVLVLVALLMMVAGLIGAIEKIGALCVVHLTEETVHLSVQESGSEGVDVYAELQQVSQASRSDREL